MFNLAYCLHNMIIRVYACVYCVCQCGCLCSTLRIWWLVEGLLCLSDTNACERACVYVKQNSVIVCVRVNVHWTNSRERSTMALVFTWVTMATPAHPVHLTFPGDNNTAEWRVCVCLCCISICKAPQHKQGSLCFCNHTVRLSTICVS